MKTKIKSLKAYHAIITVLAILTMLIIVFTKEWGGWLSYLPIIVFFALYNGKLEKNDELSRQNLSKANNIALWAAVGSLIVFYMRGRFHEVPAKNYLVVAAGIVALRSIFFLIFDDTPKDGREEEEE